MALEGQRAFGELRQQRHELGDGIDALSALRNMGGPTLDHEFQLG